MSSTKPSASSLAVLAILLAAAVASVWLDRPPDVVRRVAPPTEFSAERAMETLTRIAAEPHPTGSAAHDRVRDTIITVLQGLGLQVEQQRAVGMRTRTAGIARAARVENLLVRIKGTASTGAVLLASHYDSVPAAYGAADDGAAVAALVETARALKAGPALKNDVILLFTDGEELGLLGAAAFASQHPWAKDVRVTVNLEARGTSGASQMFETGPSNATVVSEWARVSPRPAGSSLTYEVYRRMPNDTDFSVFRTLDLTGLNFAFIGDWDHYHTPLDSLATLDQRSLQHHGATTLALARQFGIMDLAHLRDEGDLVYFSLPGTGFVARYSPALALVLAAGIVVLFLVAVAVARKQRESKLGGVFVAALLVLVVGGGLGYGGYRAINLAEWLHRAWLPPGHVVLSGQYAAALVSLVVAVWLALYPLFRKFLSAGTVALGAALVLVLLTAASSWMLAGGSYLAAWPTLALLLATLASVAARRAGPALSASVIGLNLLLSLPVLFILVPLAVMLFVTMGFSAITGTAMTVLALVCAWSLSPQIEVVTNGKRYWPAAAALLLCVVCLGWGAMVTRYSASTPRVINVVYVMDGDHHTASWTARSDRVVPWLEQFLGKKPAAGRPAAFVPAWATATGIPDFRQATAPVVDLPLPSATLVNSSSSPDGRVLRLRIAPGVEGHAVSVWVDGARLVQATIDGQAVKPAAGETPSALNWSLDYVNAPLAGFELALDFRGQDKVSVAVLDRTNGLPEAAGHVTPRPADVISDGLGDQTAVRRSYVF